jgi:hypothetical protein
MTTSPTACSDPDEALNLVRDAGRSVPNAELAVWLGLPEDSAPHEVLLFASRLRRITYLDWNAQAGTWWWNTSSTGPGARNRCPDGISFPSR